MFNRALTCILLLLIYGTFFTCSAQKYPTIRVAFHLSVSSTWFPSAEKKQFKSHLSSISSESKYLESERLLFFDNILYMQQRDSVKLSNCSAED